MWIFFFKKNHIFRGVALIKRNHFAQKEFAHVTDKNKTFVKKKIEIDIGLILRDATGFLYA